MPFFSKVFKGRDSASKKNAKPLTNGVNAPEKPQWSDAWLRTRVDPEEVVELLKGCTVELKSRGEQATLDRQFRTDAELLVGLDMPFLLLPFRPTSDPSAARTFVRNYFFPQTDREEMRGDTLTRELRLTEPIVRMLPRYRQPKLTRAGTSQRHEMVLEQIARRRGHMGRLRAVQSRRARYAATLTYDGPPG